MDTDESGGTVPKRTPSISRRPNAYKFTSELSAVEDGEDELDSPRQEGHSLDQPMPIESRRGQTINGT
jgi:hypothetical protein